MKEGKKYKRIRGRLKTMWTDTVERLGTKGGKILNQFENARKNMRERYSPRPLSHWNEILT